MTQYHQYINLVAILLFYIHSTFGQIKHEAKIDVLNAIGGEYIGSYEAVLSKRVGVEIALAFDVSKIYISDFDFIAMTSDFYEFSATRFNPSLGVKYYFAAADNGSGIFIGPYVRMNTLLSREDGYVERWEEVFDTEASERTAANSMVRSFNYGIHFGGKWIYRDRYIFELVYAYSKQHEVGVGALENNIYYINYFGKLGYRF